MKKPLKMPRVALSAVLAAALLISVPAVAAAGSAEMYDASYIRVREDLKADYTQYLDSSVMYKLPESVKADEEISLIISVGEASLMDAYENTDKTLSFSEFLQTDVRSAAALQRISQEQLRLLNKLDEQGIAYHVGETYNTLLSGFELLVCAGDYEAVCCAFGDEAKVTVGEEYQVAQTQLVENAVNVYETGIFKSGDSGYDGSGTVVAVLDTGLDSGHSAFSLDNFTSDTLALTYEDVAAVLAESAAATMAEGLTVDDVYINEKVPFGFDYADGDSDPYSTHNNHGTHVSGVITGKDDTITGVAPNAQLVAMKIFSDVQDTARSAWILAALEDCVVLDVDVINMSLGTACGFGHETEDELLSGVYEKIRNAGISLVVAASNSYSSAYGSEKNGNLPLTSNPDTGTVGSPSTYEGALSVASINGVETPYLMYKDTILYFHETTNGAAEENDFCETLLGDQESVELEYVIVPGVGRSADYTGLDVSGKIALVRRGSNTFEEKAIIAQEQGAAAIVIYNNVSGDIKMNVGDAKLAVCSISQDDGEMLVAAGGGTLKISRKQTSGPFMSDFSSWGPSPNLGIKPEITAHGGNILSSVTGGGYDRLSGTSMACPNLSGVILLLRQYVKENFPEIADDSVEVNTMVNRLMMSTADIALAPNGLPYFVRKQGAGLANLSNSIETPAIVITYDRDGKAMDKTKLELGDDPEKSGVYEMRFTVRNFGEKDLSYELDAYVMSEGVSETKTNAGEYTVTEEARLLEGARFTVTQINGEAANSSKISVPAGENVDLTVQVALSDADKEYLNTSFENGTYVEGFITLTAQKGTNIDMSIPYLAFYGDWTVAPLFDLDYYETNADELDDAIDLEDKNLPDAYSTRPIGGVESDYVSYLGSYYFLQDPKDMIIAADRDYIALSNQVGTIHSLRFVWAGLLRNAAKIEVTITDDTTGEVIYECVDTDVRKSYGDGGSSIYPANVEIEFDTQDYNLMNNSSYTVKLVGYLDYGDGGLQTNENCTFEFPLVIDFEAPTISDVQFYYEYDNSAKQNRLYAKVGIYDNHHTMAAQLSYVTTGVDEDGNAIAEMKAFEQYLTPVYSKCDSVTYVTYELTDYLYEIKENSTNRNAFTVTCYDYALNYATYEIGLPDAYTDFYMEGLEQTIELSPNEVYPLEPLVYPDTGWAELLEFTSSKPSVARVVNNKVVAAASGNAVIKVRDPETNKSTTFRVTVLDEDDEGYRRYDKPVADMFRLDGYTTQKAYYILTSSDKDIGDTGNIRFFEGNYSLSMYPSESVRLNYTLDAYFPNDTTVAFESSNENIVTIDEYGTVTAVAEGFASVTMKVMLDGRSTYYSETVTVEVKDPYITTGASLTHYYGLGGLVVIPEDLSLTEIGNFAFSNFDYVLKSEMELAIDDSETSKMWYIGENTITKVVIPEGVKKINAYAFANLTALEEVVLPSTLEAIEYGAFYGCQSLETVSFSGENNLKIINQNAFEGCDLQGTLDLSAACIISDYAFAGNVNLEGVVTSDSLLSIARYAFAGCESLTDVTVTSRKVKYGEYAFTGCESLTEFYVNAAVLPEGMFYECDAMTAVTLGPDVNDIGEFAFRDTEIAQYTVESGNQAYRVQTADHILSADGKTLVAVSATAEGEISAAQLGGAEVTAIAKGAFSHNDDITAVDLPKVTTVGDYAFGSSESIRTLKLGTLTHVGEYAFFETSITQLPDFTAESQIGRYAFAYTDITSVTVPDGMNVAEGVFSECLELETVTIGNDVTLGKYAFQVSKDLAFTVESYIETGGVWSGASTELPSDEEEEEKDKDITPVDETPDNKPHEVDLDKEVPRETSETGKSSQPPKEIKEEKLFYYEFATKLKNLTIGDNAVIGENAFCNAASLESVTLGANAQIGYMAFYNNSDLQQIDLSKAASIDDYAFSGDVYYVCMDDSMAYAAVSTDGYYMYTYHAPQLTAIDLTCAQTVGEYAFAYNRQMTDVKLGEGITQLPQYAFAGCIALKNINLNTVETVGDYVFMQSGLEQVDLSAVTSVGEYGFVESPALTQITLNANGVELGEGAFAYCQMLKDIQNMSGIRHADSFAFAYTALTEADLSGAVSLGDMVFLKEERTPFAVTLGEQLEELGDNPFAMCALESFCINNVESLNGTDYDNRTYHFDVSDAVCVIDGSLYCRVDNGLELIAYAGPDGSDVHVADGTVRITAYAFAGSDLQMVTLPYSTVAIGHKAFFDCQQLHTVIFNSYDAPTLEEEFDYTYYESYEHVPGTGSYGTYTDYDGSEVEIKGTGMVPYYMWNATGGLYSNIYYGANFVDYVGYVQNKLTMIRPVNGQNYDSYIMAQYFDTTLNGPAAADDNTLAAIYAIEAIPERVGLDNAHLVEAARSAYTKIATLEQQALVTNYADLISAEQRIKALSAPEEEAEPTEPVEAPEQEAGSGGGVVIGLILLLAAGAGGYGLYKKRKNAPKQENTPHQAQEQPAEEMPTAEAEPTENVEVVEIDEKTEQ